MQLQTMTQGIGDVMGKLGGYSVIAAELNRVYQPQPPVTRQHVYSWDRHQYKNMAGEVPPQPVELRSDARRTTPSRVFRPADWVAWYGKGTRGRDRRGWVKRAPVVRDTTDVVVSL